MIGFRKNKSLTGFRKSQRLDYSRLESRELLAISSSFHDGHLDIAMSASGDLVVVDVVDNKVHVNGRVDILGRGKASVHISQVTTLSIQGSPFETNQHVELKGNFAEWSDVNENAGVLQNLYVTNVSSLTIRGQYEVHGNFAVSLGELESGYQITDFGLTKPLGRLRVHGETWFHAANNSIALWNSQHEFRGPVNFQVLGEDQRVIVYSAGDMALGRTEVQGNFKLHTTGRVTNVPQAWIDIGGNANFTASSVELGIAGGDSFEAGNLTFSTEGIFRVRARNNVLFQGTNSAQAIWVTSVGHVASAVDTSITAQNFASFYGARGISLGTAENNSIQVGSLTLNSPTAVHVRIDGDLVFTGNILVASLHAQARGSISSSNSPNFRVTNDAFFQAQNVVLGNQSGSSVDLHRVSFQAEKDVVIQQENRIVLFGNNYAKNVSLISMGNILDANGTHTIVDGLFSVQGDLINLGTAEDESLSVRQLSFRSNRNTNIRTISSFEITGNNFVGDRLILRSAGDITDAAPSKTQVVDRVNLTAENVILGGAIDRCFEILGQNPTNRLFLNVPLGGIRDVVLTNC